MNLAAAQSIDAQLRGPLQGTAFGDMRVASGDEGTSETAGLGIAEQRSEALKTVSENKIDAPVTGGKIEKPDEGADSMSDTDAAMSRIAALLQKFAEAHDMTR